MSYGVALFVDDHYEGRVPLDVLICSREVARALAARHADGGRHDYRAADFDASNRLLWVDAKTVLPLFPIGTVVRMRPSGKRLYGGLAIVVDHRLAGQSHKRLGLVVSIEGREVWVQPGEVEAVS